MIDDLLMAVAECFLSDSFSNTLHLIYPQNFV